MARIMRVSAVVGAANNAAALILTVPAGKKYEILETWDSVNTVGAKFAEINSKGGLYPVVGQSSILQAGEIGVGSKHAGLVIEAGDGYYTLGTGNVAGHVYITTYMDVDL